MNASMKRLIQKKKTSPEEQGLSLVIALMMGMLLTVGASGLMIRQLMTRKTWSC